MPHLCTHETHGEYRSWPGDGQYLYQKHDLDIRVGETFGEWWRARRGRLRRESDFTALAEKWLAETAYESSLPRIVMHPAYQQIIGMGHEALGLILKWVQEGRPGYWFWALETIARETPVTEEMAGRTREMKAAWLKWGRQNGLVQESAPQSRDPRESRTDADC